LGRTHGEIGMHKNLVENAKWTDQLIDLEGDERKDLTEIVTRVSTGVKWLRIGLSGGIL